MRLKIGDVYTCERLGACVVYTIEKYAIVVEKDGRYYRISGCINRPVSS